MRNTHLGARTCHVGAKHDGPRSLIVELLARSLEAILEELEVTATAVAALLVLDFVLDDKGLLSEIDGLSEGRRDGVVGSLALGDEALGTLNGGLNGVLDLPLADVAEGLGADGSLLGRLGGRPTLGPVVSELLEEGGLDRSSLHANTRKHTTYMRQGTSEEGN